MTKKVRKQQQRPIVRLSPKMFRFCLKKVIFSKWMSTRFHAIKRKYFYKQTFEDLIVGINNTVFLCHLLLMLFIFGFDLDNKNSLFGTQKFGSK